MKSRKLVFAGEKSQEIWVAGKSLYPQSNILVTLISPSGEQTALISQEHIIEINPSFLVEPPIAVQTEIKAEKFSKLGKFLSIAGYSAAIALMIFASLSFTGNIKARIVLTGSMEPSISPGDVIITAPIENKEPHINDVIAYQAKRFNGENVAVFSHRIIDGDLENGFIVKGDANKSPDPQKPKAEDILGVVLFTIPFIGNLLTPKALFLLLPCLFGLWLIMDAMKNVE